VQRKLIMRLDEIYIRIASAKVFYLLALRNAKQVTVTEDPVVASDYSTQICRRMKPPVQSR
jgi:hypothetical protein